ncbi:MAG: S-methyl-5-thioribose-1-phosphate isomerase, partial [Verrucomicrobiae bacterium]|nr:S-methyl-5-thioribose-1-phosphate isomerase [Verrucomicrobiae bacterium]
MLVNGTPYRTVWQDRESGAIRVIDQRKLPFVFEIETLRTVDAVAEAIRDMHVRGAGCIGATAAYGMALAAAEAGGAGDFDRAVAESAERLIATRPTAVNLRWAVDRQLAAMAACGRVSEKLAAAEATAQAIADEDAEWCRQIGRHGLEIVRRIADTKPAGEAVNILTHCNAGWLAFVDHGSATSPIYAAREAGIPVHVWVDETRPRNQGARLTAWELGQQGIPHTVIADNTGGHLMQRGRVDLVITGTDRTSRAGDVANKIGTYLKALAARDNGVPFH